jgi:hypothetical protein
VSIIIHRCLICSHPDIFKRGKVCSHNQCREGQHQPKFGPSEVIPTFDGMGAPIASITPPGTRWVGQELCGCEGCRALYDSLSGVAA